MPEIRGVHQMCEVNDSTLYLACDTDALVELTIGKGDRPVVTAMRRYRFRLERRDCNEFYALIRESDSTLLLGMRGGYGLIRFDMRTKKYVFVDMHRLQKPGPGRFALPVQEPRVGTLLRRQFGADTAYARG